MWKNQNFAWYAGGEMPSLEQNLNFLENYVLRKMEQQSLFATVINDTKNQIYSKLWGAPKYE